MKTKIISFYSDIEGKTYYSDCGRQLMQKLNQFNVNHDIEELPSSGNYMRNCLKKPSFILSKLIQYKKPLIWMDIDTDFRSPFDSFDECNQDVGFCTKTGDIAGVQSFMIYFNYTENSILFLSRWKEECEKAINENRIELDHDVIKYTVLPELISKIKIRLLSENYMDFFNGKHIKITLSKNLNTKREAHKKIKEINKYRVGIKKENFKEI